MIDKIAYECTNKITNDVVTITPKQLAKQIVKAPQVLTKYTYKIVEDKRNLYEFECWIHPKSGGDDYIEGYSVTSSDETNARKSIEKTLKRKSAVSNDYILTHVNKKKVKSGKKVKVEEVTINDVRTV